MEWKPLWHYRVINFGEEIGTLKGVIQYMRVQAGIDGTAIRVKLDNRFNRGRMVVSSVAFSVLSGEGKVMDTGEMTVGGTAGAILEPDETVFTDAAPVTVTVGQSVEISMCIEQAEGITGICQTWSSRVWGSWFTKKSSLGNKLGCTDFFPVLAEDVHKPWSVVGISQIDMLAEKDILTISLFGDSITHMSYYSDALFERLLKEFPGRAVIANCGIGGNRLCFDHVLVPDSHGNGCRFGPAGKKRFENDVYSDMEPDIVLALLGTNDCNLGLAYGYEDEFPTVQRYADDYSGVIKVAHLKASKIYIGTIPPFNTPDWDTFHESAEARRLELNAWIRSQDISDGVIDFDAVAEDSAKKGVLQENFDVGDRLHPGTEGGRMMAAIVPLCEFF